MASHQARAGVGAWAALALLFRRAVDWAQRAPTPVVYAVVVVFLAAFLVPAGLVQSVDGDEGFYSLAAALVADGRMPYQDFAYLQTPLLPFVYGGWTLAIGESWFGIRALSCVLAIVLGVLLFHHASGRFRSRGAGFLAIALYASSNLVFQWFPLVKTYALSSLLLFGAYCLVAGVDRAEADGFPSRRRWFAAGALLGLAVDVRLNFALALLAFLVYAVGRLRARRPFRAATGPLLAGTALGALPSIVFLALDPARFVFLTVEYHRLRSDRDFWDAIDQKLKILGRLLGDDAQFLFLTILTVALVIALRALHRRVPLAASLAGALAVASIVPTPTYDQYFSTVVPFLVVGAVELLFLIRSLSGNGAGRTVLRRATVGVAVLFVLVGAIQARVLLFPEYPSPVHRLSTIREIASTIDANAEPGDVVLANWPGLLYGSHAEQLPGVENDFAPLVAQVRDLSDSEIADYKLITFEGIERAIRAERPRLVVVRPPYLAPLDLRPWPPILEESGYEAIDDVKGVLFYAPAIRARLSSRGGRTVLVPEGRPAIPVERDAVAGFVESVKPQSGALVVGGWAAEAESASPAQRVLVFSGSDLVASGVPALAREDIADVRGAGAKMSGFRLTVPLDGGRPQALARELRVVAVGAGRASELSRLP